MSTCGQVNTLAGGFYTPGIRSMQWGYIVFVFSVCLSVYLLTYILCQISQELLYLETWNFVHMTSMTSCIVRKKIRAMEPGPLELFPFVVLATLMAMAGGISEHMLTSWSSLIYHRLGIFCLFFVFGTTAMSIVAVQLSTAKLLTWLLFKMLLHCQLLPWLLFQNTSFLFFS